MIEEMRLRRIGVALLSAVCILCGTAFPPFTLAQHGSVTVDWKAELAKARAGIKKDPKSAFWHNQAGVALDALGDFPKAVKELKLAAALDQSNPIYDYALYAVYKRRGMHAEERRVLLDALERDSANPLGRFEFALILEQEGHWAASLREYRAAKDAVTVVKGPEYIDPRGNPYEIEFVRRNVDSYIDRVAKLQASKVQGK